MMHKPLQIAFRNLESSEFLEGLAREKMARLERHRSDIVAARVVFEVPHRSPAGAKVALSVAVEIELAGRPLIVARAEEQRHDMRGDNARAVTRAFEAAERQLVDVSEIREGQVRQHAAVAETGAAGELLSDRDDGYVESLDARRSLS